MKYIMVILCALVLTACSIKEPRISVGKKCSVNEDWETITYSYIWIYDKSVGNPADKKTCDQM